MRFVDVNVLVYAHRGEMERSDDYAAWLDAARTSTEVLGVPSVVIAGFIRLVTNPRIFTEPSPLGGAWKFCHDLVAGASNTVMEPGARHLAIFEELCTEAKAKGNIVPDAYLAAMAIEAGATWYSTDGDFGRFRSLDWRHPLDASRTALDMRGAGAIDEVPGDVGP